jgi:hypothetical protein
VREIWGGEISKNRFVYVFFNREGAETTFNYNIRQENKNEIRDVRELILHEEVKFSADGNFTTRSIQKHAVGVYLVQYSGPISNLQQE